MSTKRNWETQIESALIAVLEANTDIDAASIPVRQWADTSKSETYPCILVHSSPVTPDAVSAVEEILTVPVEIGVRTHKRKNTTGSADPVAALARTVAGYVRDTVHPDSFITSMNTELENLDLISCDRDTGAADGDFDNINQLNIRLEMFLKLVVTT